MNQRVRVACVGLAVAALSAVSIVALRITVHDGEQAMVRFVPRFAESTCIVDPTQAGVEALVSLAGSRDVARLRVRWFVHAVSARGGRTLIRELRHKGFFVDTAPGSTQTIVRAERTEEASYRALRAVSNLIRILAGTAGDLVRVESPRGGCEGRYVRIN